MANFLRGGRGLGPPAPQRPHRQGALAPGAGASGALPAPLQEQGRLLRVGGVHVEGFLPPGLRPMGLCRCGEQNRGVSPCCLPASSRPEPQGADSQACARAQAK